ncbi:hypothetical protein [Streptomyces sp. NPDC001388]|uniref:hypothetical protein n=1 Tax=Streptomyces sp. NPDC001388 TaxID=3364568 RepID=UPI0036BB27AA
MTSSMLGYARLPGVESSQLLPVRRKLTEFARAEGFELAEVFVTQRVSEDVGAWRELLAHAHAVGTRDVVVPSLTDLHPVAGMARIMRALLSDSLGGKIWIADEQPRKAKAGPPELPGAVSR